MLSRKDRVGRGEEGDGSMRRYLWQAGTHLAKVRLHELDELAEELKDKRRVDVLQ